MSLWLWIGLPLLFLIAFGLMGVFVSIYNYAGFLLSASPYNLSQLEISHIFYAYLLGTAASPVAGALADKLGRGPVLIAGTLLMAAGVVLTLFQPLAKPGGARTQILVLDHIQHRMGRRDRQRQRPGGHGPGVRPGPGRPRRK